ncbi:Protein nanos [Pseudolycoriella hygida]|uniref:Protein nanos n=1 Tax=Pseudolycoriella hygida TaxID=35572 RepID=A0A9Q0MJ50_9DIPT|nr:Protein nanos [Pseudolycoriella hygida]KAJ6626588.1 Protein nanos [Pseudolycoriella hygida]KAJ6641235.1 Protein nanos [Pseudolycoriella hygida]
MSEFWLDNTFCEAILQVLTIPILPAPPPLNLDDLKKDFDNNGFGDVESNGDDLGDFSLSKNTRFYKVVAHESREPLANLQPKGNSKKQKLAKAQKNMTCRFCENNEEPPHVYYGHTLRDLKGRLTCPRLRKYICPICGCTGDDAHTIRYCKKKPIFVIKSDKSASVTKMRYSSSTGNIRV